MTKYPHGVLDELRKKLELELASITTRIEELRAQDPFSDPDRVNDNAASDSEANEESSHDRFRAMIDELESKKQQIVLALAKMDTGEYGMCSLCKSPIDIDRLSILPTAELCLSCESKKKEKIVV